MLTQLRGEIENYTTVSLSSGNDSCELDEGQNSIETRTMTKAIQQQRDDILRMADETASILCDILLRRHTNTANENDKVSSSIGAIVLTPN